MLTSTSRRAILSALVALAGLAALVIVVVAARGGTSRSSTDPRPLNPGLATRLAGGAPETPTLPAAGGVPIPAGPPTPQLDSAARGPIRIRVPSAHIDASVVPVGVRRDGEVAIPAEVSTVGWYRYSALPASPAGSTVLVGHVDSAVQGEGAFFTLHTLTVGDRVVLESAHGVTSGYRVVSRQQFRKGHVPLRSLFATTGAPRLTLVTCGGSFDATAHSYRDNFVITAVPR